MAWHVPCVGVVYNCSRASEHIELLDEAQNLRNPERVRANSSSPPSTRALFGPLTACVAAS
ncbi:hypothetical protein Nepgr_015360 [Nepenthes gracilis]|uniref:Uncharacterized protein n=1 Tax=Nepenthes gracilis TaxID=150966 RepID=A0AAD3SMN7_NEPGR|nr:hypothetical protein Nepgr_015360 [Nepenthes gracilis]